MWNEEKLKQMIENGTYSDVEKRLFQYKFTINGKPESYSRERSGRGNHFYNPKGNVIKAYRKLMQGQLNDEQKNEIKKYLEGNVHISLTCKYYIPIPKSDSLKVAILKETGQMKPNKRPDLDNYDKLLLDSLHDVIYDDDSKVTGIYSEKLYSMVPRTEVIVDVEEIL